MTTSGKVLPFPERPWFNSKTPDELAVGDWFLARGKVKTGPGSWITWVVEGPPVDHGGCVGAALRALPLIAPDGSWPHEHLEMDTVYWVPLSDIEITMPMPSLGDATP